ncbi:MAG: gliding motility-associated C-terminal domain-containing protein, partial [Spirochaetes bacterium]|nr:gliding motility-associated C-terminal domain-containing protein [Spirochaetota bacterium]
QNNSANIGTGGGTITLRDGNPQDGEVKLTIPSGALNETRTITLKQIYPAPGDDKYKDTVAVYQIEPENIVFKSVSDLELLYFDLDNNGLVDSSGIQENDLTIFWHDGFEWREASGSIDTIKNVVKGNIIKSGIFGVMVQTAGAAEDIKPREKIATPNGDGVNDFLYFNGLTGQYKITIIDVNGRLINTISDVPYWDGRDENGNIVPSGIYLYEVKYNGKSVKGICAIAK